MVPRVRALGVLATAIMAARTTAASASKRHLNAPTGAGAGTEGVAVDSGCVHNYARSVAHRGHARRTGRAGRRRLPRLVSGGVGCLPGPHSQHAGPATANH